ncbi:MurR/RpiR family transcriptional regulator [Alteribacter keqinensis]|uniref:MurR/RpiR family transcriptional regulator n=1 Tax=Alteribacter keqinensis TaxID=2483800 RepID=A0A3M7TML7_9BACI|nr:MurR/RpiR family transcriptional regulator [Alteribacter keqinensis]RNA66628.1 MurR/RpiR family transcriptional regulator [Alteribacter keqinensis]
MLFHERAHKYEYKLNDTDDQIIEYILANKEEVTDCSIQALASRLYTVPNTITRLCKKLGYTGYSQLKNSLMEEIEEEAVAPKDSFSFNLDKTLSLIDHDKVSQVAKMMVNARKVLFFGVGDTAPYCELMVKNLKIVSKQTEFSIHRHETLFAMEQLTKQDMAFFLSMSGETKDVLDMAEIGKEKGVKLVSLTHFTHNSLKTLTDVNLYCYSPEMRINGFNVTDKTPMMAVLRILSEAFWEMYEK